MVPGRDIDHVIERVKAELPEVTWEQLKVVHPGADDDGLWFFEIPGKRGEVQAESSNGMCPFLIETNKHDGRRDCQTVEETVMTIITWLKSSVSQ